MKKFKRIISVVLAVTLSVPIIGGQEAHAKKPTLKLSKKKVSVLAGSKVKVGYKALGRIRVKSKSKKIARAFVKGKKIVIKGIKKGNTRIVVKCRKKSAQIKVIVKKEKRKTTPTPKPTPTSTPTIDPVIVNDAAKKLEPYAKSVNEFGNSLFSCETDKSKNVMISPLSIHLALSMLANGAQGESYNQLIKGLGITDIGSWNELMKDYVKGSLDESVNLNVANSAWIKNSSFINPNIDNDFIAPLRNYYNAEVFKDVAFDNKTVEQVNNWVSDKTNKMIPRAVEQFSSDIVAVLINTLYFKGGWKTKFYESSTYKEQFYGTKSTKMVDMMHNYGVRMPYLKDEYFEATTLYYGKQYKYAMDIFMSSDKSKTAGEVWNGLTDEQRLNTISSFKNYSGGYKKFKKLSLPKFEMDYTSKNIISSLGKLGITDIFDINRSNLAKIGKVFVSDIIHKTKLEVFEEGTKAAAVTVVMVEAAAMMPIQEPEYEFIVNRPFIFTIRDTVSGMVLFIGEVNEL